MPVDQVKPKYFPLLTSALHVCVCVRNPESKGSVILSLGTRSGTPDITAADAGGGATGFTALCSPVSPIFAASFTKESCFSLLLCSDKSNAR